MTNSPLAEMVSTAATMEDRVVCTECGYAVWYRVECCVGGCGVRQRVCVAVDAVCAVGGQPIEFGGHCVCDGNAILQDSGPFSCWYTSVVSEWVYPSVARAVVDWQCLERIAELW